MAKEEDEFQDVMAGALLHTYFLGWPFSRELTHALSLAAYFTLLKNYEIRGMKVLVDSKSAESRENTVSLKRTEILAGSKGRKAFEELAVATAGTLRDTFKQNPSLSEAVKVPAHALYFQEREQAALREATKIASHEVVLKDQQTYADATEAIIELVARKAADILARRPEVLLSYEQVTKASWLGVFGEALRKIFK